MTFLVVGNYFPVDIANISEDMNLQQHRREKLKSRKLYPDYLPYLKQIYSLHV